MPIFLACLSSVIGVSTAGISFWRGPMYGDDYLTIAYFSNIENDFFGSIFSKGRWRPLNSLFLYFTTHYFGFDYLPYLTINRILLVLCGVVSGLLAYSLSKSLISVVLVSLVVSVSHLTYMGQVGVFGFLEFGPTIFLITAIHVALRSIDVQTISQAQAEFWQIISAVLLLSACLIHERFQIASVSFWILFRMKGTKFNKLKSRSILFLLIPGFITGTKLLTDAKVLQGGGEADFITSFGQSIINNFRFSILGVFGYFSGLGYDPSALAAHRRGVDLNLLGLLIHLFPLSLLIGLGLYYLIKYQYLPKFFDYKSWFLISLALCFLLISSTIISRIEGRWLFQSEILIAITIYSALGNLKITTLAKQSLFHLQILPFLLISSIYNLDSSKFTLRRDRTSSIVLELERISPKFIDWKLAATRSGKPISISSSWEFAYGRVFTQLITQPEIVSDCSNIPNCVNVDFSESRLDFNISQNF